MRREEKKSVSGLGWAGAGPSPPTYPTAHLHLLAWVPSLTLPLFLPATL